MGSAGSLAGSLALNQRFEEAVRHLVGKEQWRVLRPSKGYETAANDFEKYVKRNFMDRESHEYEVYFRKVKLRNDLDRNLDSSCWTMKRQVGYIFLIHFYL